MVETFAGPTSICPEGSAGPVEAISSDPTARIRGFLDRHNPPRPCLVMDLPTVEQRFCTLRAALPGTALHYAVKANPAPEVVRLLVDLGASFDAASPAEIDLCIAQGAAPETISYGNTLKKRSDIAHAYQAGVRLFATDSVGDVDHLAAYAPGASVFCRILVTDAGSRTPLGRKFGCTPETAVEVLRRADRLGLDACGVSFHVGSQQLRPWAWDAGICAAAEVFDQLAAHQVRLRLLNLGGGLPARYREKAPALAEYAGAISASLGRHFGDLPAVMMEPGRAVVAEAGLIRCEVVLVSRKSPSGCRWVYLDVGRYQGLAETENEAIAYPIRTSRDADPVGPVVIAGPTCDGNDVLYERSRYRLPTTLRAGDQVDLLSTGAYTASYSSVEFNGFPPLAVHCVE
ncbi:MAG TPA: type III PLP-dependent enzyme [Cryptosporangiaceae bacterium]|nr:type III PLP-dependent enzyme [Cryptosporangiaceae bacterium]